MDSDRVTMHCLPEVNSIPKEILRRTLSGLGLLLLLRGRTIQKLNQDTNETDLNRTMVAGSNLLLVLFWLRLTRLVVYLACFQVLHWIAFWWVDIKRFAGAISDAFSVTFKFICNVDSFYDLTEKGVIYKKTKKMNEKCLKRHSSLTATTFGLKVKIAIFLKQRQVPIWTDLLFQVTKELN